MNDEPTQPGRPVDWPIGAILFDLDGTLVDSRHDITGSVNHLRGEHGLAALSVDDVAAMVGLGIRALLERSLGDGREIPIEAAVVRFRAHYREHCLDRTVLYPGVRETLDRLGSLRLAVVSNKPEEFSRKIVEGLGIADHFGTVVGGDTTPEKKPHPEPLHRALRDIGSLPREALMVGDSDVDVNAGRRAGVRTCAVRYGIGNPEAIDRARPRHRIDRFAEILGLVEAASAGESARTGKSAGADARRPGAPDVSP